MYCPLSTTVYIAYDDR